MRSNRGNEKREACKHTCQRLAHKKSKQCEDLWPQLIRSAFWRLIWDNCLEIDASQVILFAYNRRMTGRSRRRVCPEPVEITRELVLRLFLSPILITTPHCIIVFSLHTKLPVQKKVFRERAKTRERKARANAKSEVKRLQRVSRRKTASTEHAVIAGASRLGLKIFSHVYVRRKKKHSQPALAKRFSFQLSSVLFVAVLTNEKWIGKAFYFNFFSFLKKFMLGDWEKPSFESNSEN